MPQDDDLDRLIAIGARAPAHPAWQLFGLFLDQRGRGLRPASFEALRSFVAAAKPWGFEQREAFVRWVTDEAEQMYNARILIPHILMIDLVAPTIREWLSRQPQSAVANYLFGKYCPGTDLPSVEAFRRSVALDPDFQLPRRAFINSMIRFAEYNQHELPCYGYLGDAGEDVRDLIEAQTMLAGTHRPYWRESIESELCELLETARAWLEYSRSGEANFAEWCRTHNGPASFVNRHQ